MASFDPSVISQIPDMAGNPAQAQAGAYKLADLIEGSKLRKLQLSGAQQDQKRDSDIRTLLSGAKLDTPEDRMKVGSELMRIDPSKGMQFMRETSQEQLTELQTKKTQMEFLSNEIGPSAVGLLNTLDTKGPAMAQAEYQQLVPQINARLKEVGIKQQLPPQMDFSNPQTRNLLQQQIAHSTTAGKMLQEQLAQKRDVRQEEAGARAEKMLELAEARGARADKAQADKDAGAMGPEDLRFAARQYLAGDKSVFQNLGRGAQGAKNVVAMRSAIRQEAEAANLSPQDVATKIAEFGGLMAEERAVGTRQAAIETAATEASKMIPIALKASEELPRGKFRPINQLIQKGQVAVSDPELARFAQANLTLANIYARAVNPTGVPTDSARDHAIGILSMAQSQESYRGVIDIMKQEIEAARSSPPQVRQDIRASVKGQYNAPAPGPVAGSAPGAPAGGGQVVNWADLK
jgi:hypothetical protein